MFDIDLMSRVPIYEQLYRRILELVLSGVLHEQDKLPSVRSLATELGVNPNTIAKAYALLERDGITFSLAGRGSFIAAPDIRLAQGQILTEFDEVTRRALDAGILAEDLKEHVTTLAAAPQTAEGGQA